MCFTYEPERKDKCCGASGRKLRRVCIYCPNYKRHWEQKQQDKKQGKEEKENEKGD